MERLYKVTQRTNFLTWLCLVLLSIIMFIEAGNWYNDVRYYRSLTQHTTTNIVCINSLEFFKTNHDGVFEFQQIVDSAGHGISCKVGG